MYYAVTHNKDTNKLTAHDFTTIAEAAGFRAGVEYINDSAVTVVGIYSTDTEAAALERARKTRSAESFLKMVRESAEIFEMRPGEYVDKYMPNRKVAYVEFLNVIDRNKRDDNGLALLP